MTQSWPTGPDYKIVLPLADGEPRDAFADWPSLDEEEAEDERAEQRRREATYTCLRCAHSAPWTDGQSRDAGDPVDEYWCQTCGYEQPLPQPDAPAVR